MKSLSATAAVVDVDVAAVVIANGVDRLRVVQQERIVELTLERLGLAQLTAQLVRRVRRRVRARLRRRERAGRGEVRVRCVRVAGRGRTRVDEVARWMTMPMLLLLLRRRLMIMMMMQMVGLVMAVVAVAVAVSVDCVELVGAERAERVVNAAAAVADRLVEWQSERVDRGRRVAGSARTSVGVGAASVSVRVQNADRAQTVAAVYAVVLDRDGRSGRKGVVGGARRRSARRRRRRMCVLGTAAAVCVGVS